MQNLAFCTWLARGGTHSITKALLRMKLTAFLLTVAILNTAANGLSQSITLSGKNLPLERVLNAVKQQTGYPSLYSGMMLAQAKPVTLSATAMPLTRFLDLVFKDQPLKYTIEAETIILSLRPVSAVPAPPHLADPVTGTVRDAEGKPLAGATITISGKPGAAVSDEQGRFSIDAHAGDQLVITYVGYITATIKIGKDQTAVTVVLKMGSEKLDEVAVLSTGYQKIPEVRATGSFTIVNKEVLNRSVSTDILSRLDGVTSGLIFNKIAQSSGNSGYGGDPAISIRGRSTIFSNTEPLVVLDNFPYGGDLTNINPNDIESVTVLKDASAASIWGVRSANGVIVLTSKKGRANQRAQITFNSNFTLAEKSNIYAIPQLSSADYIGLEKFLFDHGQYDYDLKNRPFYPQSPVIDILDKEKRGLITHNDATSQLNILAGNDVRSDISKYFLRRAFKQQYALTISGGSQNNQYYISGGFDRNIDGQIPNTYNRYTINAKNTCQLPGNKLSLSTELIFTKSSTEANPAGTYSPNYPYEKLVGANGQALPVMTGIRQASKDALSNKGYLDWNYYPYNERLNNGKKTDLADYLIKLEVNYKIYRDILSLALNYQYEQGTTNLTILIDQSSYSARSSINQFTQIDSRGNFSYPVPLGDILTTSNTGYRNNTGRIQANYNQVFARKHQINALAGFEVRDNNSSNMYNQIFGYNPDNATSIPVDYFTDFPSPISGYSNRIQNYYGQSGATDRFISYYSVAAYTYNSKYSLTASGRRDESNLFGVKANQKGVPLYSLGLSWDLSRESFYQLNFLPNMKIRFSDGYSGNLNSHLSAYTTASTMGSNWLTEDQQRIVNPPNPSLVWERVQILNTGIDYAFKDNRISGSIDLYSKRAMDLIGNSPQAGQTGVLKFTGNTATMLTRGIDIVINTINCRKPLGWTTQFLFSFVRDKITDYKMQTGVNDNYASNNYANPLVGKPMSAILAYPWAGLDNTGDPQGILDGKITKDYPSILNSTDLKNLKYIGTSQPTISGSLRNNFTWRNLDLSFNIKYKLGYYFRRGSYLAGSTGYKQADFGLRWQNPGDEQHTIVPALKYPLDWTRNELFGNSEVLVEKGDHIRLQDIQIGYNINLKTGGHSFSKLRFYGYVNNLGIIWRANKLGLDPDYCGQNSYFIPDPKSFALGLSLNF